MREALKQHWPEYLIEAACLGTFMVSACAFATLLFHPASPASHWTENPVLHRVPMGLAMGATLIALIHSPWGKQSGAHMNPAMTLTFLRLGKIEPWDAFFYVAAQFAGGIAGTIVAALLLGPRIRHPLVNYATTVPGNGGAGVAFLAEALISFVLLTVVLRVTNNPRLNRFTGLFAAMLVATYITLETPLSGMSMNPARTLGSAVPAEMWTALWVYFTAPPLGMLLAAELYVRQRGLRRVLCAKLHHENDKRCIFRCNYMPMAAQQSNS
jgi:aquaporin Z